MKYMRIKNNGEIEAQALHLLGASTKVNDESKIGQFGSGNKYAMAFFLRNGFELSVFSGENQINIETRETTFREETFDVVYIDGERTSITTKMGKDWKLWQAIREVYCNALDEGGCSIDFVSERIPIPGETHFYIVSTPEAMKFMTVFGNYFSINKKVLFECDMGRIVEKSGEKANIYRRGIRCYEEDYTSVFDYDFNDIDIDENRLVKYSWQVQEKIWQLISKCTDEKILRACMLSSSEEGTIENYVSSYSTINFTNASEEFKTTVGNMNVAPDSYAGLLDPEERLSTLVIPNEVFKEVRKVVAHNEVSKRFQISRNGSMYRLIEPTELQKATIKETEKFFIECGFEINYPIHVALFDNKEVLGCADDGKIIISDIGLTKGVCDVVNTIIEENTHLKYGSQDRTRGFQTALITELVEYMKKKNAYVI